MTANAFISASLDPPLVLVSLDNRSIMHRILPGGPLRDQRAGRRSGRLEQSFRRTPWDCTCVRHRNGIPLVGGSVAYFVVEVLDTHPAGDHTLYVGGVEHFESSEGKPLLSSAGATTTCARKRASRSSGPRTSSRYFRSAMSIRRLVENRLLTRHPSGILRLGVLQCTTSGRLRACCWRAGQLHRAAQTFTGDSTVCSLKLYPKPRTARM